MDKFLQVIIQAVNKHHYVRIDLEGLLESFPLESLPAGVTQKQQLDKFCQDNNFSVDVDFSNNVAVFQLDSHSTTKGHFL